jgi:Flp pilus assembly protein TadD
VSFYGQSLRIQPEAPEVLGNLGVSLMRLQRLPEAIAAFRRSADLRPGNWRGWMRLAAALEQVGRVDEATPAIVRALDLDAKSTLDSAALLVRQTDGRDPVALDLLAAAQAALGRFEEAVTTASRALEISPPIPKVLLDRLHDRIELYRQGRKLAVASK